MNEDIIAMAREAYGADKVDAWHNGFWTLTQEELERFFQDAYAKGQADEREVCALILDKNAEVCRNNAMMRDVLAGNAAAIRARGNRND